MNIKKTVKEVLKNVLDPIKKKDIISLKSLEDIKINNKTISIKVSLSPSSFKLKEVIRRNCISNLNKVFNDIEYDIKFILNDEPPEKINKQPDQIHKKFKTENIKNIIAVTSGKEE